MGNVHLSSKRISYCILSWELIIFSHPRAFIMNLNFYLNNDPMVSVPKVKMQIYI